MLDNQSVQLNKIQNKIRSKQQVSSLAVLSIEHDTAQTIDFNTITRKK